MNEEEERRKQGGECVSEREKREVRKQRGCVCEGERGRDKKAVIRECV